MDGAWRSSSNMGVAAWIWVGINVIPIFQDGHFLHHCSSVLEVELQTLKGALQMALHYQKLVATLLFDCSSTIVAL